MSTYVLYGSQTGNAEEISLQLANDLTEEGFTVEPAQSLDAFAKADKKEERLFKTQCILIIVCSTTGAGDPPDNSIRFRRIINKLARIPENSNKLANVRFCILGLGDSNYSDFGATPKFLQAKLLKLGATEIGKFALADDATGMEDVVEPWKAEIGDVLEAAIAARDAAPAPAPAAAAAVAVVVEEEAKVVQKVAEAAVSVPVVQAPAEVVTLVRPGPKEIPKLRKCKLELDLSEDSKLATSVDYHISRFAQSTSKAQAGYLADSPIMAKLHSSMYLTGTKIPEQQDRVVLHCAFTFPAEFVEQYREEVKKASTVEGQPKAPSIYNPGAAVGFYVPNVTTEVQELFTLLGVSGATVIQTLPQPIQDRLHCTTPCTLTQLFTHCVDIRTFPRKFFIRMLAHYCTVEADEVGLLNLCAKTPAGKALYTARMSNGTTVIDLLKQYQSCKPNLAHVLEMLPPLMPRFYSVATSSLCDVREFAMAFTLLKNGLGTNWLHDVCLASDLLEPRENILSSVTDAKQLTGFSIAETGAYSVPVYIRRAKHFTLPSDPSITNLILVGTGTGVAPLRGFLDEAALIGDIKSTLYFGCRHKKHDYLYREDFMGMQEAGILDGMKVAYSRMQEEKEYVQHLIVKDKDVLAPLLQAGNTAIYVCGDGSQMPKDVTQAFIEVLGGGPEAIAFIKQMKQQHLYVEETWS
jgi:methionine synthase reductase